MTRIRCKMAAVPSMRDCLVNLYLYVMNLTCVLTPQDFENDADQIQKSAEVYSHDRFVKGYYWYIFLFIIIFSLIKLHLLLPRCLAIFWKGGGGVRSAVLFYLKKPHYFALCFVMLKHIFNCHSILHFAQKRISSF